MKEFVNILIKANPIALVIAAIGFLLNARNLLKIIFLTLLVQSCSPKLSPPPLAAEFGGWSPPKAEFENQHKHWAYCVYVYDGDSATFWIENGFNHFQLWKTRFLDINAPEVRGKEKELGLVSKKWLAEEILGKYVLLEAPHGKLDKYGRLLVRVYSAEDLEFNNPINLKMVNLGLAEIYMMKEVDLLPQLEYQPLKN